MAAHTWDPARYLAYADERGRPFVELLARVDHGDPAEVVDLGCGPGNLTDLLAERWPAARVTGLDSSPEMIATARGRGSRVAYDLADLRAWRAGAAGRRAGQQRHAPVGAGPPRAAARVWSTPSPRAACSPSRCRGTSTSPATLVRHELAAEEPYAAHTRAAPYPVAHDAATYLRALRDLGCEVDAWETTYLHVLHGPDPVFAWTTGTGARPTIAALPDDLRPAFEEEFRRRLRAAYPDEDGAVVLPFRRVFAVARRPR